MCSRFLVYFVGDGNVLQQLTHGCNVVACKKVVNFGTLSRLYLSFIRLRLRLHGFRDQE